MNRKICCSETIRVSKLNMQTNLNFSLLKSTPLILQSEIAECGLASMSMNDCHYGYNLYKEDQYDK